MDCSHLAHIDLSGNAITSLAEIVSLDRLPSLGRLELSSKDFGANPLCCSLAYPMSVHESLPSLVSLDGRAIDHPRLVRRLVSNAEELCRSAEVRLKAHESVSMGKLVGLFENIVARVGKVDRMVAACSRLAATPGVGENITGSHLIDDLAALTDLRDRRLEEAMTARSDLVCKGIIEVHFAVLLCQLERLSLSSSGDFRFLVGTGERWEMGIRQLLGGTPLERVVRLHGHQLSLTLERTLIDILLPVPPSPISTRTPHGGWISRTPSGTVERESLLTPETAPAKGALPRVPPSTNERFLFFCGNSDGSSIVGKMSVFDVVELAARGWVDLDASGSAAPPEFCAAVDLAWTAGPELRVALLCRVILSSGTEDVPSHSVRTDKNGVEFIMLTQSAYAVPAFLLILGTSPTCHSPMLALSESTTRAVEHVAAQLVPFRGDSDLPSMFYTSLARVDTFDTVTALYLSGMDRAFFPGLVRLKSLRVIDASNNDLQGLASFAGLASLAELSVAHNQLISFSDLGVSPKLTTLNAQCNAVDSPLDIGLSSDSCPKLVTLDLRLNPFRRVRHTANIPVLLARQLPACTMIQVSESAIARVMASSSTVYGRNGAALLGPDQSGIDKQPRWIPAAPLVTHASSLAPPDEVEGDHQAALASGIDGATSVLDNGPMLTHLRCLVLADAGLTVAQLEPLRHCGSLGELCLAGNEITSCWFLPATLSATLWRLDLDRNAVVDLGGISLLTELRVLSIQDNLITSFTALVEPLHGSVPPPVQYIFAAGNLVQDCRAIFPLRECRGLRGLSLARNPCAAIEDYRVFLAFHLTQLEVLDGSALTVREERAGATAYNGLLSIDVLVDEFGDSELSCMQVVALPQRGYRALSQLTSPTIPLHTLTNLDLSGNEIDSMCWMHTLPALRVLVLDDNKVGSCAVYSVCTLISERYTVLTEYSLLLLHLLDPLCGTPTIRQHRGHGHDDCNAEW